MFSAFNPEDHAAGPSVQIQHCIAGICNQESGYLGSSAQGLVRGNWSTQAGGFPRGIYPLPAIYIECNFNPMFFHSPQLWKRSSVYPRLSLKLSYHSPAGGSPAENVRVDYFGCTSPHEATLPRLQDYYISQVAMTSTVAFRGALPLRSFSCPSREVDGLWRR